MRQLLGLVAIAAFAACGGGHDGKPDASGDGIDAPGGVDAAPDGADVDAAPDGPDVDAAPDAAPTFGLTSIFAAAASRQVTTGLSISGFGIAGTPAIHLANCDQPGITYDLIAGAVTPTSIATTLDADPARVQGLYTVTVTNGDGMVGSLTCALRILAEPPPTVTVVVPTTAYHGVPNDNINSDATVSIQGTGFLSTPGVRWVSTTDPSLFYEAVFVGFESSTQLTASVPSETLMMPAGTYHVFVTNPDTLTGEWLNGATPGLFTITDTAPPQITDVSPSRITNGTCTSTVMTLSGSGFLAGATAWFVAPAGTTCAGSTTDASGQLLCPLTVGTTAAASITATFPTCPGLGPYPVVVINPDGQSDYYFSIEVTPSSDGHLNTGPFETLGSRLETARWKHAAQYGFDSYSDSIVYVAGGQDAAGTVLGSVEASLFNVFGTPGPFRHVEQYAGSAMPRVPNNLVTPREGATLVRVGKSLFAIGGTASRSDVVTPVAASRAVERAQILSYAEMPGIKRPVASGTTGLPVGSWYYRVSAVGPWGESLATREVVALNKGGSIEVCWVAPQTPGATSYNVYRSLAADGHVGTAAALAYEVTSGALCFTDDGLETRTAGPGNTRGTLAAGGTFAPGAYSYRVSAVVPLAMGGTFETYAGYASATTITAADVLAGTQTIQLAWDAPTAATGVTYRVYRLDPTTGTFKRLAGADALTTTTFADTNVAFDASGAVPRGEVRSLPTGSLSKWNAVATPQLLAAREGLDGVVVNMDPATSGNLVARILVAGGRDGTGGAYTYRKTAESLGVYADGTTEAVWSAELPQFASARAYYSLLTTQDRNATPFPPPPEQPPCGDCTVVTGRVLGSTGPHTVVSGSEPVEVIAVFGDDAFSASNNQGRNDFEACSVDATTGHLACGATWTVQNSNDTKQTFGADAVLYFSYLYPFYGVASETITAAGSAIAFINSAIGRFPLLDLTTIVGGQVLGGRQSASTSFNVKRAYYQMLRLLAYVYTIGGYADTHVDPVTGLTVPAGPSDLVERHQQ